MSISSTVFLVCVPTRGEKRKRLRGAALKSAVHCPRIRVRVVAVRLAAGFNERGRMTAHPRRDFWLSALLVDFAFTATSFFAGAEKRKQKLRCGASAAEADPRARRRLSLAG
jgi:hypothetical protein